MLSLPLPLLLLIHIHLLDYPHADEPEYDEHVFNAKVRGLRDRTKTMEDLCYFLVGKIEQKPRMKSLFPTYPCLQPSDSVAFRTVLAKYLEGLRNQVVRPETLSRSQRTSSKGKSSESGTTLDPWWWKDVVVRKSLLEECTGNRFERMIIALSTHALFANTNDFLNTTASDVSAALSLLPTLPRAHVSLKATIRGARRAWERSAALLQQRQADSKHSGSNDTASRVHESNSQLAKHSLGELASLCEQRQEELLRGGWQGEVGLACLDFVIGLVGLSWPKPPSPQSEPAHELYISPAKIPPNNDFLPPLPTAAAHHPQHMGSFLAPVMSTSSITTDLRPAQTIDCGQSCESTTPCVNVLITERLAAEEGTKNAFSEALNRMRTMRESLQVQLRLIPEGASAQSQNGSPSDVPAPPAPSKDVTVETQTQEQAARPRAQKQAKRMGRSGTPHSAAFPLPKVSQTRNPPSRFHGPSVPILDTGKHRSDKSVLSAEPAASVAQSAGTEDCEHVSSPGHRSVSKARATTTATQERKIPIINFDEDEAFLPSDLKPSIKPPAPPKFDFIEDNSAFLPSFLKREMIQTGPSRWQAPPASPASSRESTPEHGTKSPSVGGSKDENDWSYEGKSMTLRDILVRAGDATFAHFDILHEEDVDVADETLGWE
ncbi:hypothetical protein B0F90DRAFT_1695561 [Multifurca ochricompacta]|uniref:HAUS augmin-like complex subunit 6 N-terminal domain-containing protein n=1 Tax=Multifurca ochricompacta TaxID=376703 RepID=A0AAD4MAH9_9AGAM|nr:hypothetical protein B0F90DRAFT_1695561 [Multifurca ochricompacta]